MDESQELAGSKPAPKGRPRGRRTEPRSQTATRTRKAPSEPGDPDALGLDDDAEEDEEAWGGPGGQGMPYVIVAQQRPSYDKAADDELRQLDEALHGTDDPSALPNVVWDGTDDQDSIALDAVKVAISPKPNRASAETRS